MLNGLDLFSGIGGITLALAPWVHPIAYCEIDRYAQSVLLSRMADTAIPTAPIWDDVRTLQKSTLSDWPIDIIYGGFPCQDISVAGNGAGLAGERSGLFYEIVRLCREIRPAFTFLENVPAITTRGGAQVVRTLATMGYDCRWCVIPSGHTKEGFRGDRWFCLAKAESEGLETSGQFSRNQTEKPMPAGQMQTTWMDIPKPAIKPDFCGIPYGLSNRVDRIKCLGNAVVPIQARTAFQILSGFRRAV